jgi:hypothetical protein
VVMAGAGWGAAFFCPTIYTTGPKPVGRACTTLPVGSIMGVTDE